MKINIVSCIFSPEPIVSARTSADLAKQLAQQGHRVRVIAAYPNRPAGKLFEGYQRRLWSWDRSFPGYQVLRVFSILSSDSSLPSRFLENISFAITSAFAVLILDKPDVLFGNVWPIFAQGLLAVVCRMRGIPLILSVQDVYPESLSTLSQIGNPEGWLFRLFRWIDRKTKQSCAAVVVISQKFRQIYVKDRGIRPERVHMIPNWVDENEIELNAQHNDVRASHGIPEDAFLVMYAGNVGAACGLEAVIQAFQDLALEPRIHLLVAGSGSKLNDTRVLAEQVGNRRIHFHTPWLASETSSLLAAADLFILPTHGDQSLVSVPSKLITYMLAGRPILCCATDRSDIARTVRQAACGWTIPAGEPSTIARMLLALSRESAEDLRQFGRQGRDYALQHMTRAANLPRLVELIERVGSSSYGSMVIGAGTTKGIAKQ
jgi:glycosyltransferase involved in cell wall biosynthesis